MGESFRRVFLRYIFVYLDSLIRSMCLRNRILSADRIQQYKEKLLD